jgi:Ca-activated chloride channel family protein
MKRNVRLVLLLLVGVFVMTATTTMTAQAPSDPNLVYVHVTASDRAGRFVTALHREQFKIFEDNVPQDIAFFSDDVVPTSVGVLLDVEEGMKNRVKDMASGGLGMDSSPSDEFFIADAGKSPLNDAVYQAFNLLLQRRNTTRALVLFTSRNDPGAGSFSKVKELLKDQDVRLYVIALPARADLAADQARPLLRELAEMSGGAAFFPTSIYQVPNIYNTIAQELRNLYLIGYRPTNGATDGKLRKIKINASNATVRAKTGYYAPTVARPLPAQK